MGKTIKIVSFVLALIFIITAYISTSHESKKQKNIVNLNKLTKLNTKISLPHTKAFYVAVSAMMSPVQNYDDYKPFLKYLQDALQMPVKLVQRKTYGEINSLIRKGKVDLAFICTGAYVYGNLKKFSSVVAVPKINGNITYNAYIIVHKPSNIHKLKDLRGKSFAFMDPLSNTGYFYPMDLFKQHGINPKTFFKKITFTHSHTYSIEAVAQGVVIAASVDGIVYNYVIKQFPKLKHRIKILLKSPPFAMPPVVIPKTLEPSLQHKIQNILINMDKNERGRHILKLIGVDKFILPPKNFYKNIYCRHHES